MHAENKDGNNMGECIIPSENQLRVCVSKGIQNRRMQKKKKKATNAKAHTHSYPSTILR